MRNLRTIVYIANARGVPIAWSSEPETRKEQEGRASRLREIRNSFPASGPDGSEGERRTSATTTPPHLKRAFPGTEN